MTVCIDCKERTSSDVLTFFVMYDGDIKLLYKIPHDIYTMESIL